MEPRQGAAVPLMGPTPRFNLAPRRGGRKRDSEMATAATALAGGSHSDQVKTPHGLDRKEYIGIDIEITPTEIVHSVLRGGQWVVIDKWEFPEGSVHGKFGFSIPGKDEIGLKDFALTH